MPPNPQHRTAPLVFLVLIVLLLASLGLNHRGAAQNPAPFLTPTGPSATPGGVRVGVPPYEVDVQTVPRSGQYEPGRAPSAAELALPDLDLLYIGRMPAYPYDQAKTWPDAGETVTFQGHVTSRGGAAAGAFHYAWYLDGRSVSEGDHQGLAVGAETVLSFAWPWQNGNHTIRLALDPHGAIAEGFEGNNAVEDRTNALALGVWVEQSFWDCATRQVPQAGWGGSSYADWIQRHVQIWNRMLAEAVHPLLLAHTEPDAHTDGDPHAHEHAHTRHLAAPGQRHRELALAGPFPGCTARLGRWRGWDRAGHDRWRRQLADPGQRPARPDARSLLRRCRVGLAGELGLPRAHH